MSTKYHWGTDGKPSCGMKSPALANGFFYDTTGGYFTDEAGQRVKACAGCLLIAVGAGIRNFQNSNRRNKMRITQALFYIEVRDALTASNTTAQTLSIAAEIELPTIEAFLRGEVLLSAREWYRVRMCLGIMTMRIRRYRVSHRPSKCKRKH